jgi:hypothetical protein
MQGDCFQLKKGWLSAVASLKAAESLERCEFARVIGALNVREVCEGRSVFWPRDIWRRHPLKANNAKQNHTRRLVSSGV